MAAIFYYGFIASNQYQAEPRFGVRSNEGSSRASDLLGGLATMSGLPSSASLVDSYIIVDFLRSPDLVREVDEKFNLRKMYGPPADWVARVPANAQLEDLTRYWRDMVRVRVDSLSQSIVLNVRAFSPDEALALSEYLLSRSEALVNTLSERARAESLAAAAKEVKLAEERLRANREAVRQLRDQSKVLDPIRSVAARQELITHMQNELSSLNAELRAMSTSLDKSAPSVVAAKARIASLEAELAKVRDGGKSTNDVAPLPGVIQEFEDLHTETSFSEKAYMMAMASLERARAEADRKTKYVTVHVRPVRSQIAVRPRRLYSVLEWLVISLMSWGTGWLIYLGVRDHAQ